MAGAAMWPRVEIRLVDADGHIMEPSTMWSDRIDPRRRDLAVTVIRDAARGDRLAVAGQAAPFPKRLGGLPAMDEADIPDWNGLDNLSHYCGYDESCFASSREPGARLDWMDRQGIARSLLFPSLGLIWPRQMRHRPDILDVNFQAYNRWIAGFAAADPARLVPVAQTFVTADPDTSSDLHRIAADGFGAIMFPVLPPGAQSGFAPEFAHFWRGADELGLLVCVHKAALPMPVDMAVGSGLAAHTFETLPGTLLLADIFDKCAVDLFPGLRFAFLELFAGWVPPMLDRMDESYGVVAAREGVRVPARPPRTYIEAEDRFFFALGPTEDPVRLPTIAHTLMISSDFPHPGCSTACGADWQRQVAGLDEAGRRAVLSGNADRAIDRRPIPPH